MTPPLGCINRPWGRFTLERALEGVAAAEARHGAGHGSVRRDAGSLWVSD